MNARDDFAIWLKGYLDGKPDGADQAVKDKLEEVIGAIVAERLRQRANRLYDEDHLAKTFGPIRGGLSGVGIAPMHSGPLVGGPLTAGNVALTDHTGKAPDLTIPDRTIGDVVTPRGVHWGIQEPDAHMKV